MKKLDELLEIYEHREDNFKPVVDYGAWRVALLNSGSASVPDNITFLQKHNETDEIFVLLSGKCVLFVADGEDRPGGIYAEVLQPLKVYNVKRGVWHTHILTEGTAVLVVENRDTTAMNSPKYLVTPLQKDEILHLYACC